MDPSIPLKPRMFRPAALLAAGLCALAASLGAQAQVAAPFIGTWQARWVPDGKPYDATLTVTETGGTWKSFTQMRSNLCAGREVPLRVDGSSPTSVQFTLMFSEVVNGCQNVQVQLTAGPDGTVTGTRSKYPLTLERQK